MITVIADDVTGAAEIAGICLRYGIDVAFGIDTLPENLATVTVIATDSRSCLEEEAYTIYQQIAKKVIEKDNKQIVFKKCDSVLRGHILAELTALAQVLNKNRILLQPANPISQRCIRNGIYYVNSVKINDTDFATDPGFPAVHANVNDIILKRPQQKYSINKVYTGAIKKLKSLGINIPDCNTEEELSNNLELYTEPSIIGGSAAFFEQFLNKMNLTSKQRVTTKLSISDAYVLVSGSTHPKSVTFSKTLQDYNCKTLRFPKSLLTENSTNEQLHIWVQEVVNTYTKNKKLSLRVSDDIIRFTNSSEILKQRMSTVVKGLIETEEIQELFIEGGATAYAVLKELEWYSFTPTLELALGVVRMKNNHTDKYITIKPGSYNWPEGVLQ